MTSAETANLKSEVIVKAWSDPHFKLRLLADPTEALKSMGVQLPGGLQVSVVEDTPDRHHWVIPLESDPEPRS